jgi:hypothetical protein
MENIQCDDAARSDKPGQGQNGVNFRCVGWLLDEGNGSPRFIGYTKEKVPGPRDTFWYAAMVLVEEKDKYCQSRHVLKSVRFFRKGEDAAETAMQHYCKEAKLTLPQTDRRNKNSFARKRAIRKLYPVLDRRTVLNIPMPTKLFSVSG